MRYINQVFEKLVSSIKSHPKSSVAFSTAIVIGWLIRNYQKKLIYHPQLQGMPRSPSKNRRTLQNPSQYGGLIYENIHINIKNGALRGWIISSQDKQSARLILYYHQNAGNIGLRLQYISEIIAKTNSDVMIVGYRGFSDSDGTPSYEGIKQDGLLILEQAIKKSQERKLPLYILGRSLGGAVAINSSALAKKEQKNKIVGLILENTFTSIQGIAQHFVGKWLRPLLYFLVSNKWQSYKLIHKVQCPTLFMMARQDELIPMKQMEELFEIKKCLDNRSRKYVMNQGTHNITWSLDRESYFNQFIQFFEATQKQVEQHDN